MPESIPSTVHIESSKIIRSETLAAFNPLIGNTIFDKFNAGKSDRWAGVFTLMPDTHGGDLGALLGWLALVGKTESFFAFDPSHQTPKMGVVSGLLIDGAAQQGRSFAVKGGAASTSSVLMAGDYVQVGTQYFRLTRNLDTDGLGTGTMSVWPAIRTSPATNEPVVTDHPKIVARITSPIPEETTVYTRITFSWEEFI